MSLYSWDYEANHPADEWFRTAHAYADASVTLFEDIAAGRLARTFHHSKVGAAAFEHGLELFLKGALVLAGERPGRTHNLKGTLGRFRNLYPGSQFDFTGRIDEAARDAPGQPPGQFLRYPAGPDGIPWPGNTHFDLDLWIEQTTLFRDDYRRLEPLLRKRA